MTPDGWRQAHELFDRTLEQDPASRSRFIQDAAVSPAVQSAVEALLLQHERLGNSVLHPLLDSVALEQRILGAAAMHQGKAAEGADVGLTVADRYVLERELGSGGSSVVYLAHDRVLPNKRCVVKILKEDSVHGELFERKFQEEISAQVLLEGHEGIVAVSDKGRLADGRPYFIMQHVEGTTLRAKIADGPLPFGRVGQIVRQIGDALTFAHQKGIYHLDLKPSNIILQESGAGVRVWLIDFGTAKITSSHDGAHTTTRVAVGTPPYMAPEQYMGRTSQASDVYAFGMIVFEMLTGTRPDEDDFKELERLRAGNKSPWLKYRLPSATLLLIAQALAFDPSQRHDDAAGFAEHLTQSLGLPEHHARKASPGTLLARAWDASSRRPTLRTVAVMVPVLGIGVAGAALWLKGNPIDAAPPVVEQLTSDLGDERFAALSPDGNYVAFSWTPLDSGKPTEQPNTDIYIKPLGVESSVRLTFDSGEDSVPVWSPDGRNIAFVRRQDGRTAVYVTPPVPQSERKIGDFEPAATQIARMQLSWTPDGKALVFGALQSGLPSISLIPVDGGTQRILLSNSGVDGTYCFPTISPSGKRLAYALCKSRDGVATDAIPCDIYVQETDATFTPRAGARRLTHHLTMIQGIAWTRDSESLVYGFAVGGNGVLSRVSVGGGQSTRVEFAGDGEYPTVARVADRMAFTRDRAHYDLWKFESGRPAPVISSTADDFDPQISTDGKRVAFSTDRSGKGTEIWVAALDGTGARRIAAATGRGQGSPRWSPDDRWIAWDGVSEDGSWDIFIIDAAGGQPRRLTTDPGFENFPSWSRDGNWIYFRSTRNGRSEVWRMHPHGGPAEQVTTTGAASAWESWDGRTLYYTRHDGLDARAGAPALFARAVSGGSERKILDAVYRWDFVPVQDGIYYIVSVEPRPLWFELRFLDTATGTISVISRFQARISQGLTASSDGKTILYSGISAGAGADLLVIHNFR
jgi:Tol biopolymer transport system component